MASLQYLNADKLARPGPDILEGCLGLGAKFPSVFFEAAGYCGL